MMIILHEVTTTTDKVSRERFSIRCKVVTEKAFFRLWVCLLLLKLGITKTPLTFAWLGKFARISSKKSVFLAAGWQRRNYED